MKAIDRARIMYEEAGKDFDAVLANHLQCGIVICSPLWFLMLRAEQWSGRYLWFVECAVGDLAQLATLVSVRLPFIAFCRVKNGKKQTKVYKTERLLRLAALA